MMKLYAAMILVAAFALCACPIQPESDETTANTPASALSTQETEQDDDEIEDGAENDEEEPDPADTETEDEENEPETSPAQTLEQQRKSNYVAFEGGLRAYPDEGRVEMDAYLLGGQTRPLEYLLVLPGGNTHESLFSTGVRGLHLKRALEIIGLNEGKEKRTGRGYLEKPVGDRVRMKVRFEHQETGEETVVNVEEWLWDHDAEDHPSDVGFIFTGGYEKYRPELNRTIFEADQKGNIIALWRDASCVLDNDREKAYVPDIYSPYSEAEGMPQIVRGMTPPVTLIFEAFKE